MRAISKRKHTSFPILNILLDCWLGLFVLGILFSSFLFRLAGIADTRDIAPRHRKFQGSSLIVFVTHYRIRIKS